MALVLGSFWRRFVDILPKARRYTGTIISVVSPGVYTVQLIGGGLMQATGIEGYTDLDRVFLEDGRIEGKAPNLPSITIDV